MDEQGKRRFGMDDEEVKVLDMFAAAAVAGLLSRMDIIDEEECREGISRILRNTGSLRSRIE